MQGQIPCWKCNFNESPVKKLAECDFLKCESTREAKYKKLFWIVKNVIFDSIAFLGTLLAVLLLVIVILMVMF